jgi:hypothetical protein
MHALRTIQFIITHTKLIYMVSYTQLKLLETFTFPPLCWILRGNWNDKQVGMRLSQKASQQTHTLHSGLVRPTPLL